MGRQRSHCVTFVLKEGNDGQHNVKHSCDVPAASVSSWCGARGSVGRGETTQYLGKRINKTVLYLGNSVSTLKTKPVPQHKQCNIKNTIFLA